MLKKYNHKILLIFALILLMSKHVNSNWRKVEEVVGSSCILSFENIILVGSDNGIYRSFDNGSNWSHDPIDKQYPTITDLCKNENYIFAGTYNGVYTSTDTGKNWISLGPPVSILSVYAKDSIVLACMHGGGLYRSENNGQSWTEIDGNHYYSYLLHDNKIFAGTFTGIYVSIDNGLTWDFAALPNRITTSLSKNNSYFFAVNYTYGIYRSDDYGISWVESNQGLPLDDLHPYTVFAKDNLIFAGFTSNKIYLSTDNGGNWKDFSDGIDIDEETYHVKFAISGNKIFVSFLYNSLWYDDLSQMINVSAINSQVPESFVLHQNYPNPFNPKTTIVFELPKVSEVKINILNLNSQLVAEILNGRKKAGLHSATWDASNHSAGIYLIKMTAGDFIQTKKCILLK